ncbi:MAG: methyltransferase domain-containing protein [Bacteroidetes bacterium]|nr:MAG: methyltransferase domain-containing protein [Bacteroidota bacterium]
MKTAKTYVLREKDPVEIRRLAFQHEVWRGVTGQALAAANVQPGQQVIDLGCGPGYLSEELSGLVGPAGRVTAVDNSEHFLGYLKHRRISNVEVQLLDILQDLDRLPPGQADAVFCRWVLMFLPQTSRIMRQIYRLLKPGGQFISMEYFRFRDIAVWPDSPVFKKLYKKVYRLIRNNGGDPNIGSKMPTLMYRAGFEQVRVIPVYRTGKSGSELWEWISQTNANHENLVRAGLIPASEYQEYLADWAARSADPNAFVLAPPLMITIGKKL